MTKVISIKGWVYIISNKSMSGLVKVGFSMKDPKNLAKELDSTGSPHPFTVEYAVLVQNPRAIEKKVKNELNKQHEAKDWFRCCLQEAQLAINNVALMMAVDLVVTHGSKGRTPINSGAINSGAINSRAINSKKNSAPIAAAPKRVIAGNLFLNELRRFVASDEYEFHINETRLNTLWPASNEEINQNKNIIFSLANCYHWIRENNLNLVLNTANTSANLEGGNLFRRDLVFYKNPSANPTHSTSI